jgi:hypothetical protein
VSGVDLCHEGSIGGCGGLLNFLPFPFIFVEDRFQFPGSN